MKLTACSILEMRKSMNILYHKTPEKPHTFSKSYCNIFLLFIIVSEEEWYNVVF